MKKRVIECNFECLVGPTHNFSGLAFGNVASMTHEKKRSHPKKTALLCLQKMWLVHELGIPVYVLPPHERPHLPTLKRMGFSGSDKKIIEEVGKNHPHLLYGVSSSSSMWAANSATVTPSIDSIDKKVHITIASLLSTFHRGIEAEFSLKVFQKIFSANNHFFLHPPLPIADEGSANHIRFFSEEEKKAVHLFVYGKELLQKKETLPARFPARQPKEAFEAIRRLHQLPETHTVFAKQHPEAIDHGVFHNDVISTGNENFFLLHEKSFVNQEHVLKELRKKIPLHIREVKSSELSLEEAVESYFFNSQIFSGSEGMTILLPKECKANKRVCTLLNSLLEDPKNPLKKALFVDLKESMMNGGGPACLRLRLPLTEIERSHIKCNVLMSASLYRQLTKWIETYFPEELTLMDLQDPSLYEEMKEALHALTKILQLGSIYSFQ